MKSEPGQIIVPDGRSGAWAVESFTVSEQDSAFTRMRAAVKGDINEYVPAGNYKRLVRDGTVVMSNTPMEIRTNYPITRPAKGSILVNGLGLGMVLTAILPRKSVKQITVIENSKDVIKLVAPSFEKDPRVTIIHADAFTFKPVGYWDYVWHDIWDNVCGDNLVEMKKLHRKYQKHCGWQGCWCEMETYKQAL